MDVIYEEERERNRDRSRAGAETKGRLDVGDMRHEPVRPPAHQTDDGPTMLAHHICATS